MSELAEARLCPGAGVSSEGAWHPGSALGGGRGWGQGWANSSLSGGCRRATLVCAWAEEGADALGPDGRLLHSDAFPPPRVVDTLGAGDTFNAAVIFSLSQGEYPSRRHRAGARKTRLTWPLVPLSREEHAGGSEVRLPGGWQEVRSAGF